ncbi:MAG: ATP-dependent Clp protease adaptor ClpS [Thermogutta sp.]
MTADEAIAQEIDSVQVRPRRKRRKRTNVRHIPRYNVVLWDDDDHTYEYVIRMLMQLFGHPFEKAYQMAKEVDLSGRCIVLTTTKEHAELKRDQIHAFGRDPLIDECRGSMTATIEPADD